MPYRRLDACSNSTRLHQSGQLAVRAWSGFCSIRYVILALFPIRQHLYENIGGLCSFLRHYEWVDGVVGGFRRPTIDLGMSLRLFCFVLLCSAIYLEEKRREVVF